MWRDFIKTLARLVGRGTRRISMDPDFEAERLARARRIRLLFLAGILLISLAWVGARPLARFVKGRHAANLAAESIAATERRDLRLAAERLSAAAALSPAHPRVALAQGRLLNAVSLPEAVAAWERVIAAQPGVPEYQLELALAYFRAGRLGDSARAHAAAGASRDSARGAFVAGLLAASRGEIALGESFLRHSLQLEPARIDTRIALGQLLLAGGPKSLEGRQILEPLREDALEGRRVTAILADHARNTGDLARGIALAQALADPPGGKPEDLVRLVRLLGEAHEEAQLDTLVKAVLPAARQDRKTAAALLGGLIALQRVAQADALVADLPTEIWTSGELLSTVAMLSARSVQGEPRLRELLRRGEWTDQELLRAACSARLAGFEGEERARSERWERARSLAGTRAARQQLLALAREWSWGREQLKLLGELAPLLPPEIGLLREWHRMAAALRDTAGVAAATEALLAAGDVSSRVKNDFAAASILLGQNRDRAARYAFENFSSEPADPNYLATYASSLRQQGRAAEALNVVEDAVQLGVSGPSLELERAAALEALGRREEAVRAAAGVPRGTRCPEEEAILTRLQQTAGKSDE